MEQTNPRQKIILITTGGTIEKTYDEFDGSLSNRESVIKQSILNRMRLPYTNLEVFSVLSKDSLYMTEEDRALLVLFIKNQIGRGHPIVILHGTDTMAETARYCFEQMKASEVTVPVVFTGAMKPLGFTDSDAPQNVTEALLASKLVDPGFYISFHNRVFKVPGVRKNKEKRTFEAI